MPNSLNKGSIPKVLPSSGIIGTIFSPISDFIRFLNKRTKAMVVETFCPAGVPLSNSEYVFSSGKAKSIGKDLREGKYPPSFSLRRLRYANASESSSNE